MNKGIQAVLFDLDDTLLPTKNLEAIRLTRNLNSLLDQLEEMSLFNQTKNLLDKIREKSIKLGLITNSPRWYVNAILDHFNLDHFQVIVAYDDVAPDVKPSPLGIIKALKSLQISDPQEVIYIGDQDSDVNAAYAAGVIPIVPTWLDTHIPQMPACVVNSSTLIEQLDSPSNIRLLAEVAAEDASYDLQRGKDYYFSPINLESEVVMPGRRNIQLVTFGRYFSTKSNVTAELHATHKLSRDISKKDHQDNFVAPEYWVKLFCFALERLSNFLYKGRDDFDIVTVIPSKPGKTPRLENMLERIENTGSFKYEFIPDLFQFSEDAQSLKTLGGRVSRNIEICKSLTVKRKYSEIIKNKKIFIIDDVITTGATFSRAFHLLKEQQVDRVLGICLAKTVYGIGEQKECPSCGRHMRAINGKHDIQFWGCSGFRETVNSCKKTLQMEVKKCPKCKKGLVKKYGKNGYFLSHDWALHGKDCKYTESIKE